MPHPEIPWNKIAVFDVNHGGLSIAKRLAKDGITAVVFDVYQKMPADAMKAGTDETKIKITADADDLADGFEIVCLPVHLNPKNIFFKKAEELGIPMVSHHEMTGKILKGDLRIAERCLIEITGVRGKTSTAVLLAQMLSYKNRVLLHTSEGMTIWDNGKSELVEPGISITPAYMPNLIDMAFERGYMPDTLVFEVSLGFTGAQDIGVFTEAHPGYRVAGDTMTSSDAKTKMISRSKEGGTFVINCDAFDVVSHYIRADQKLTVFNDKDEAAKEKAPADIYVNITTALKGNHIAHIESPKAGLSLRAPLSFGYDVNSYKTAMAAATAAALEQGVSQSQIAEVISEFRGVLGRMHEYEESGRLILDNSNSGLSIEAAEAAVKYMLKKHAGKKIVLIIGEEEKTVCEGLDPKGVEKIIADYKEDISNFIFVGERMKPFVKMKDADETCRRSGYADSFKEGLKEAIKITDAGDIIVTAVKCFR